MEVDLRTDNLLVGVVTQGSATGSKWPKYVTSFQILYRPEGSSKFDFVSDEDKPIVSLGLLILYLVLYSLKFFFVQLNCLKLF